MRRLAFVACLLVASLAEASSLGPLTMPNGTAGTGVTSPFATNKPVAWDYIADLTSRTLYTSGGGSTTYSNCPDLFAAAFEPYNRESGGVSNPNANLLIRGSCSVTNADLNPVQYYADTDAGGTALNGPYNVIAAMIPTKAYANGLPVSDAGNISNVSRGLIRWDGVQIDYNCSGQTKPTVMLQLGDIWMEGHTAGSTNYAYGQFTVGPTHEGKVVLRSSGSACNAAAVEGQPLSMDSTGLFTTTTTTVGYWQQGYNRSNLGGLHVTVQRPAADYDDLGALFMGNNESTFPHIYATGGGTGVQFIADNVGSLLSGTTSTGNSLDLIIGDGYKGGSQVFYTNCAAATKGADDATRCNSTTNRVNGVTLHQFNAEAGTGGPEMAIFAMGSVGIVDSHLEMTSTNLGTDGYIIGATTCATGTRAGKIASNVSQCTGGGTLTACASVTGFTGLTIVNTHLGSETDADSDTGALAVGYCTQPGDVTIYGGFTGYSTLGASTYRTHYFDSTTGAGNRVRLNLESSTIASPAIAPNDYGYISTGSILQGITNPTTTFAGQQADIFHNTVTNEILMCVTTDGRCDTAAEWVPVGPKVCNSWTISSPGDSDDHFLAKAQTGITYTDLDCIAEGGGTITLDVQKCSGTGTGCATVDSGFPINCDSDGTADDGSLSNASINAGDWVKALYSAPTGTVSKLTYTLCGYGK